MNRIHCSVIRDLLPLYVDKACSSESAALVEEHLKSCPVCRALSEEMKAQFPAPPPAPSISSQKLFHSARKTILGIILAAAVMIGCFITNIGGAWYGGPANGGQLAVTILYSIFWGIFTVVSRTFSPLVKTSFLISLVTFLSAASSLICRLLGSGGFIAAFASVFASVPFYGLRFMMDWTGLYTAAAALSLIWMTYSALQIRKLKKALQ